jgi:hypothetical protein
MSHPLEVLRQVVTGSGGPFITEVTAVDAFTLRHLSEYIDACAYEGHREAFMTWTLAQLADDAEWESVFGAEEVA